MADEKAADSRQVITSEVEASEQTVQAVRSELSGGPGAPLDRLPYQDGLAAMANAGIYTKRIASTDRCIRVVEVPVQGGAVVRCHCSRACVSVGDMKLCPDHDKAAFQPNQTPVAKGRVINSASIPLTNAEKEDLAKVSQSFAQHGENTPSRPGPTAVSAFIPTVLEKRCAKDKDCAELGHDLKVYFSLDALDAGDVRETVAAALVAALDMLPAGNVREMKRIVALQERLQKAFLNPKGGKKHGRSKRQADKPAETL